MHKTILTNEKTILVSELNIRATEQELRNFCRAYKNRNEKVEHIFLGMDKTVIIRLVSKKYRIQADTTKVGKITLLR